MTDKVEVKYLGSNCLHFTDGYTDLLVDPYVLRNKVLTRDFMFPSPGNMTEVGSVLEDKGISTLDGILLTHSHFDHILDAPAASTRFDAMVYGSKSCMNVMKGAGLDRSLQHEVRAGEQVRIGDFSISFIPQEHQVLPWYLRLFQGDESGIHEPMRFPARLNEFKQGPVYSLVISHPYGRMLVTGSAGDILGPPKGIDTMFLTIGGLDRRNGDHLIDLITDNVVGSGAKRCYLTHWDDYVQPLGAPGFLVYTEKSARAIPKLTVHFDCWSAVLPLFDKRQALP